MRQAAVPEQQRRDGRGQSLLEVALFLPIMIFMLIGFVEIGVLINDYINALDASRASARYASPSDPTLTACQPFHADAAVVTGTVEVSITFKSDPCHWDYPGVAAKLKQQEIQYPGLTYDACKNTNTINFFYVAGCMAVLNMPRGAINPNPKSIWGTNDYAGDDVIVTTIPITHGGPQFTGGALWWSLYGNQPTPAYPSFVISPTANHSFVVNQSFIDTLNIQTSAPPTGLVVVEVYRAHPQLIKLFTVANGIVGGSAVIPDPIPIHTFTVFPVTAIEPR